MAKAVRKEMGRLDVLINNAGVTNMWEPITDGHAETYFKTWDLHVKGTYLMSEWFLHLLVETAKNQNVAVDIIDTSLLAAHFVIPGASA